MRFPTRLQLLQTRLGGQGLFGILENITGCGGDGDTRKTVGEAADPAHSPRQV